MTRLAALTPRAREIIKKGTDLPAEKRAEFFEVELKAAVAEQKLLAVEHFSFRLGAGASSVLDLNFEDPRFDDHSGFWQRIGIAGHGHQHGHHALSAGFPLLHDEEALRHARHVGRFLAGTNPYAIGAHTNRQNYIIGGTGIQWRAIPRDLETEDKGLTRRVNEAIEEFSEQENLPEVSQETVWRGDRDGEAFLRLFSNADGPMRVRFEEPENVRAPSPTGADEDMMNMFGVRVDPMDPLDVLGYWIAPPGQFEPTLVDAIAPNDLPNMVHVKMNVDRNQRRGWPTMWPIRGNLERADKLLRNMSLVAALQAAIALIRKHENATQSQVETFADNNTEFLLTDTISGQERRGQRFVAPGIIDQGPGYTYEAPVSGVNAGNNVQVLRAELRAGATRLVMPEFMFTSDLSGAPLASTLVGEAPAVKQFESLQGRFGRPLKRVVWTSIRHDVFWGRLPQRVLKNYRLQGEFPTLIVRDQLQEAQRFQIMNTRGVVSRLSWRAAQGFDDATEEMNLDLEAQRGYSDTRAGPPQPGLPPPGATPGGPGGDDQAGNLASPETAPTVTS